MPLFTKDKLSENFSGSSFLWKNIKTCPSLSLLNPAVCVVGLPLLALDTLLLPLRALSEMKNQRAEDKADLKRLRKEKKTRDEWQYATLSTMPRHAWYPTWQDSGPPMNAEGHWPPDLSSHQWPTSPNLQLPSSSSYGPYSGGSMPEATVSWVQHPQLGALPFIPDSSHLPASRWRASLDPSFPRRRRFATAQDPYDGAAWDRIPETPRALPAVEMPSRSVQGAGMPQQMPAAFLPVVENGTPLSTSRLSRSGTSRHSRSSDRSVRLAGQTPMSNSRRSGTVSTSRSSRSSSGTLRPADASLYHGLDDGAALTSHRSSRSSTSRSSAHTWAKPPSTIDTIQDEDPHDREGTVVPDDSISLLESSEIPNRTAYSMHSSRAPSHRSRSKSSRVSQHSTGWSFMQGGPPVFAPSAPSINTIDTNALPSVTGSRPASSKRSSRRSGVSSHRSRTATATITEDDAEANEDDEDEDDGSEATARPYTST